MGLSFQINQHRVPCPTMGINIREYIEVVIIGIVQTKMEATTLNWCIYCSYSREHYIGVI